MNDTTVNLNAILNPIDRDFVREQFRNAQPFRFFCIDNLLRDDFANDVLDSFPSLEQARQVGHTFNAVNERGKVQVTDSDFFPQSVQRLNGALASPPFLELMSYVTGIADLLADDQLVGGGIHETGPRGHLDVHVDFNLIRDRQLHRRLNILIYFNKDWQPEWGGNIELWDADVQNCVQSFSPIFNRCVVFETNEISYHGVSAVQCPPGHSRKSFAAYYYTKQAPAHFTGSFHDTIFRARPGERMKGHVLMPLERAGRLLSRAVGKIGKMIRGGGGDGGRSGETATGSADSLPHRDPRPPGQAT